MNATTLTWFSPHFIGVSLITMAIEVWGAVIAEIEKTLTPDVVVGLGARAVFANTAVDRIAANQAPAAGLDVTVEDSFEWVIERRLFTVDTGHATTAYFRLSCRRSLAGRRHRSPRCLRGGQPCAGRDERASRRGPRLRPGEQEACLTKSLKRFANPALPDTPERVGRQPIRKLSRHKRFIGPAAQRAELQAMLRSEAAADLARQLTGLDTSHPLFERVEQVIAAVQDSL